MNPSRNVQSDGENKLQQTTGQNHRHMYKTKKPSRTHRIGLAIARRLAQDGAHVVVSSRKKLNVDRAVEELVADNLSVSGVVCHLGKEEDRQRLVATALEHYGGIDYMISSAGVNPFVGNILDSTPEVWEKIFDANVKSTFLMAQLSVPHMQKRGGGSIVFVSSISAYNPAPIVGPYCVSKTALLSLTKVLAPALAPMNIRVNCLAAGLTRTKFADVISDFKCCTDCGSKMSVTDPHDIYVWCLA
ncbi:dehydrogenase/reductase SDR family member 4-like [Ambystoma mexicanum]|uniref:dehydrogenase/reductase SDR family member 4-like n=1 Tax=Ambystoma mexicanum TaxID=8296 RepID=UPI0037E87551